MQSQQAAVILSRGSVWNPEPWEPPYLMPEAGRPWPECLGAWIEFTDTDGNTILELTGVLVGPETKPEGIRFRGDPDDMDLIPAGANFEVTLNTVDGPYKIRYGKVIRKEVTFTPPPSSLAVPPQGFADSFQRSAIGRKWVPIVGQATIHDNSDHSLPNGLGAKNALFSTAALRYYRPFTTDSLRVSAAVLNPGSLLAAKTSFVIGSDIYMTSGLVMQLETGTGHNYLHTGTLGPDQAVSYQGSAVSNTVANGDGYSIAYNDETRILAVYKGTSLEPLIEWPDDAGIVPHGRGYRYFGVIFGASALTTGIQLTSISAKDGA